MDTTFPSLISSANSILILLPTKPYFDEVAGALSLYLSLMGTKNVSVTSSSPMVVEFNRLVGVNKITQELGNKNLVVRFKDYPAESIERVSADVDGEEFRLTVIPKTGVSSPKREQVELSFSGVAADLVILIGGISGSDFPTLNSEELGGAKIVHVGVKQLSAQAEKGIMSYSVPVSSVSELVAILIGELGLTVDNDTATNLIAGVEEGSKSFTGEGVTADTFEVFANLLRSGGVRSQKGVKKEYPQGSIPGQALKVGKVEKKENVLKVNQTEEVPEPAPKDWFEPKIYKGTSVS